MRRIAYLHGFRSSPASVKARLLREALRARGREAEFWCEPLAASPRVAAEQLHAMLTAWCAQGDTAALVGSSLGGFYATVLAEALGLRAVLLNPAVEPARDLRAHVGRQTAYHDPQQAFDFLPAYVDELAALRPVRITQPERYLLIAATGDEVLDYREMLARYPGCRLRLVEGGNHGLDDFAQHLDAVLAFCDGD
ncbi:MAG: esterase [Betaproteobacteria bacterium]|nr:esterase [Betaproteobacteria bacterium]